MERLKTIISVAGILLLILSAVLVYVAMQGLRELRPAEDYEDRGVHSFQPYEVYPVQVENTGASGRERRMRPTKTVYMVYYRAVDGSGYQWSSEASSKDRGREIVAAGETMERRVLSIPSGGTYITIEPDQTAGSYTEALQERYTWAAGLGALYIFFYITGWFLLKALRRLRKERAEGFSD